MNFQSIFAFGAIRSAGAVVALGLAAMLTPQLGHAGLFEDEEARHAILDVRKQIQTLSDQGVAPLGKRIESLEAALEALRAQNTQLGRALIELQNAIDLGKKESASAKGSVEQLQKELADARRGQKQAEEVAVNLAPKVQSLEQRLAKLEPVQTQVNGVEVWVAQDEKREYEAALASFQSGDYVRSQKQLSEFVNARPRSVYAANALFWLGNAQYALRDYGLALQTYRSFVAKEPGHAKAPEAQLGIANCQLELKDLKGMKKSLEDLVRLYPQSDAAIASAGRLKALK